MSHVLRSQSVYEIRIAVSQGAGNCGKRLEALNYIKIDLYLNTSG